MVPPSWQERPEQCAARAAVSVLPACLAESGPPEGSRALLAACREQAATVAARAFPARAWGSAESPVALSSPADFPAAFLSFATTRRRRNKAARAPNCSIKAHVSCG